MQVFLRMYEGWAHTDAILEAPLSGDMTLCLDILTQIRTVFPVTASPSPPISTHSVPLIPLIPLAPLAPLTPRAPLSDPKKHLSSSTPISSIPSSLSSLYLQNVTMLPPHNPISPSFSTSSTGNNGIDKINGNNCNNGNNVNNINNGNGLKNVNSVSTLCPRCSLRFTVTTGEKEKKENDGDKAKNRNGERIKGIEKENKVKIDIVKNNANVEVRVGCVSEYFGHKNNVKYVTAHPIPSPVKNVPRGYEGWPEECSHGIPLCHCERYQEQSTVNNMNNLNSLNNLSHVTNMTNNGNNGDNGDGRRSDSMSNTGNVGDSVGQFNSYCDRYDKSYRHPDLLTDCHVPPFAVKLAKYVNPF